MQALVLGLIQIQFLPAVPEPEQRGLARREAARSEEPEMSGGLWHLPGQGMDGWKDIPDAEPQEARCRGDVWQEEVQWRETVWQEEVQWQVAV